MGSQGGGGGVYLPWRKTVDENGKGRRISNNTKSGRDIGSRRQEHTEENVKKETLEREHKKQLKDKQYRDDHSMFSVKQPGRLQRCLQQSLLFAA